MAGDTFAQNKTNNEKRKKELEAQRKKKEAEIKLTKKLLSQTQTEKKKSLNHLRLLNKQIGMRQALIQTVNQEINGIDLQIFSMREDIDAIRENLELRKKEYAEMLYLAYKQKMTLDPLTFVISASNFNQAARRIKFLRNLSESRTMQMDLIRENQEKLESELNELEMARLEKSNLLSKQEEEKTALEDDKKEEDHLVTNLKRKESDLRKDLKAKQKAARKLDAEIKRIIKEEIERARKEEEERRKKAGGNTKKSTGLKMTPEAAALSANFTSNKGKLPWPVEKGFVIKSFGEHRHPTLPNVKTVNNGVDIVTSDGASARAVFEGEVRAVFNVPGMQNAVMVNHGEFYTVYTHLETVFVKKGDKVKTKQALGKVYKDPDDGKSIVHFELWKGSEKQDPESWISK